MKHSKTLVLLILILIVCFSLILRFIWLDRIPSSLYTDEADQGYNAYSILLTGRDEHGAFLPVALRSFGDWKPPLPTYLMIPFIKVLGLSEISVRLPSSILGVGTIILTFLLVSQLLKGCKDKDQVSLLSAFFMSLSPWHILQSRSAMLVMVALFFLEGGILFFLKGVKKNHYLLLSSIFFSLSIYSYYALRVISPLIVIVLIIKYRRMIATNIKPYLYSVIIGLIFLLPFFIGFIKEPDVLFGRAKTVSIFYDQGVKLRQWELITQDGLLTEPLITRFFHNNYYMFGKNIFQRFLSHFDPQYLLLNGDKAQPFQIPNMGLMYLMDYLLIIIGFITIFKKNYHFAGILSWYVIISHIPAAFTFMTPSSNRTFFVIVAFMILQSIGLIYLTRRLGRNMVVIGVIIIFYIVSFNYFLRQYFLVLPNEHADWWNYGWKEVVSKVNVLENKYDNVIVADLNGMPYVYFLFYNRYDPLKFQKEAIRTNTADRFGFEHVEGFNKYLFPNNFNWKFVKNDLQSKTLYVIPAEQVSGNMDNNNTVYLPSNKPLYKIIGNE